MLSWTEVGPNLEACGFRGWYVIRRNPGYQGCILQATGHDQLPLLGVDPYGKPFNATYLAQAYANRLDKVRAVEPACGGE